MERRKFLGRLFCADAVLAIVYKIIPKKIPNEPPEWVRQYPLMPDEAFANHEGFVLGLVISLNKNGVKIKPYNLEDIIPALRKGDKILAITNRYKLGLHHYEDSYLEAEWKHGILILKEDSDEGLPGEYVFFPCEHDELELYDSAVIPKYLRGEGLLAYIMRQENHFVYTGKDGADAIKRLLMDYKFG